MPTHLEHRGFCFWLQFLQMIFAELGYLGANYYLAVGLIGIFSVVLLMIILCGEKCGHGFNFGHNLMFPNTSTLQIHDHLVASGLLKGIVDKYGRSVLWTYIRTLPVHSSWIMNREENLYQVSI